MSIDEVLKESIVRIIENVKDYKDLRKREMKDIDSGVLLGFRICLDIIKNNLSIFHEEELKEYGLDNLDDLFRDIV